MAKENPNTGGRKTFKRSDRVRYLTLDGRISDDIYLIDPGTDEEDAGEYVRSDRKGHILLQQENGPKRTIKIQFRRVLPLGVDGKALVIESGDKYRAICPTCGCVKEITSGEAKLCCSCGEFSLHWLGAKPMTDSGTKATEPATTTTETAETKPKAEKKPKAPKPAPPEPVKVDFAALIARDDCELWTKRNVKFDHPGVDVKAHALLFTGDEPRKLCFNTYDDKLGKKSPPLPVTEFVEDKEVPNAKRPKPWFAVKDLAKTRAKLTRDGYEQA
jgi:hypothetical protein